MTRKAMKTERCPGCVGTGTVIPTIETPLTNGKIRYAPGPSRPCPHCEGTGIIELLSVPDPQAIFLDPPNKIAN